MVVRANPSKPPHSLPLLIRRIEKVGGLVFARTHVHSTVASDPLLNDSLRNFISSDVHLERSKAHLAVTLIWTKGIKGFTGF